MMKATLLASILALASRTAAHAYIYRVTADNTVYPGWDVQLDPLIKPTPDRIAFGGGFVFPILDAEGNDIACNRGNKPAPGAVAQVRAGSEVTFHWSQWLYSHKGPITAWMAPYEGDIGNVNVNELEFFKFAENIMDDKGVWGTVKMMDDTNGTWTATIPADIRPGTYVIRQEIVALHFAVATKPGFEHVPVGPQFYMTCFNFNVTGDGESAPEGVKFPGAYRKTDAGLHYDVKSSSPYPTLGPKVYESAYDVKLAPKEYTIVGPTGNGREADTVYYTEQNAALEQLKTLITYIVSLGG